MARFIIDTQYLNDNGDPLAGGKLHFYESGSTTDKTTYSDADMTIANTNPVVLDAAGRPGDIFFSGVAKMVILDASDVQIEVLDPIGAATAKDEFAPWNALITYDIDEIVQGSDNRYYRSITNTNLGNDPTTTSGEWMMFNFVDVYDAAYTYATGMICVYTDDNLYVSRVDSNIGNTPASSPTEWRQLTANVPTPAITSSLLRSNGSAWVESASSTLDGSGVMTVAGLNATTADIDGGAVDGAAITGCTVEGSVIGGVAPAAGSFTTVSATSDSLYDARIGVAGGTPSNNATDASQLVVGDGTDAAVGLNLIGNTDARVVFNTIETTGAGSLNAGIRFTMATDTFTFTGGPSAGAQTNIFTASPTQLATTGSALIKADMAIDTGSITSASGAITFGNENLVTTGTFGCGALTSTGIDDNATSTAITIDSSENVGIGTDTPLALAHIFEGESGAGGPNASADTLLLESNANCGLTIQSPPANTGNIFFGDSGSASIGYIIYDHSDDSMKLGTSAANGITIDSSQQVGIDTDTPLGKLHVFEGESGAGGPNASADTLLLENSANCGLTIQSPATNTGNIFFGDAGSASAGFIIYDHSDDTLKLGAAAGTAVTIDSGQKVGFGTASPSAKVEVYDSGAIRMLELDCSTTTIGYRSAWAVKHSGTDMVVFTTGPITTFDAKGSGGLIINASGTSATNDIQANGNSGIVVKSTGVLNAPNMPTSSAGLVAGDLWSDGGTIKIV